MWSYILIGFLSINDSWNPGVLVTNENEVIQGTIKIEWAFNAAIIKLEEGSKVYSAHKLTSFRFYDESLDMNRRFISLDFERRQQFFEVVVAGNVEVLRIPKRHKGIYEDRGTFDANPLLSLSEEANGYEYFVRTDTKILTLKEFRHWLASNKTFPEGVNGIKVINNASALIKAIIEYNQNQIRHSVQAWAQY